MEKKERDVKNQLILVSQDQRELERKMKGLETHRRREETLHKRKKEQVLVSGAAGHQGDQIMKVQILVLEEVPRELVATEEEPEKGLTENQRRKTNKVVAWVEAGEGPLRNVSDFGHSTLPVKD